LYVDRAPEAVRSFGAVVRVDAVGLAQGTARGRRWHFEVLLTHDRPLGEAIGRVELTGIAQGTAHGTDRGHFEVLLTHEIRKVRRMRDVLVDARHIGEAIGRVELVEEAEGIVGSRVSGAREEDDDAARRV